MMNVAAYWLSYTRNKAELLWRAYVRGDYNYIGHLSPLWCPYTNETMYYYYTTIPAAHGI